MIIGVSGKAGSGKDLTASIIQYQLWKSKVESAKNLSIHYTFKDFINNPSLSESLSGCKNIKYADKLKDIVCLLIGCTREQLEDREFKEEELGKEWWTKTVTYIDREKHTIINPTPYQELNIKSKYPISCNISILKPTPRMLLQQIGTDLFRKQLHPQIWVNATMSGYKPIGDNLLEGEIRVVRQEDLFYPNWIITDVRFPNEAKAITDKGGINIRIERSAYERNFNSNRNPKQLVTQIKHDAHESETALDNYEFDYVINNDGTIEELIERVKEILLKERLL